MARKNFKWTKDLIGKLGMLLVTNPHLIGKWKQLELHLKGEVDNHQIAQKCRSLGWNKAETAPKNEDDLKEYFGDEVLAAAELTEETLQITGVNNNARLPFGTNYERHLSYLQHCQAVTNCQSICGAKKRKLNEENTPPKTAIISTLPQNAITSVKPVILNDFEPKDSQVVPGSGNNTATWIAEDEYCYLVWFPRCTGMMLDSVQLDRETKAVNWVMHYQFDATFKALVRDSVLGSIIKFIPPFKYEFQTFLESKISNIGEVEKVEHDLYFGIIIRKQKRVETL